MRTVYGSKGVQSPLTSADESSVSESWPVSFSVSFYSWRFFGGLYRGDLRFLSTVLNSGSRLGSAVWGVGDGLGGGLDIGVGLAPAGGP
jgi:hypothetical protein